MMQEQLPKEPISGFSSVLAFISFLFGSMCEGPEQLARGRALLCGASWAKWLCSCEWFQVQHMLPKRSCSESQQPQHGMVLSAEGERRGLQDPCIPAEG